MTQFLASDPSLSTVFVLSTAFACTVLTGVWAVYDGIRIGGLVKRGEV